MTYDLSLNRSHAGTVVPECFKDDNASQWKSGKFDPRSLINPWTDRHQNLHAWLSRGPLPLCKISSRYDYPLRPPNMRKCASSDSASFFWFFRQPIAKTPAPIFTINTSNDAVSRKDVPFGGPENKILHFDPIWPQNSKFFDHFRRDSRQKGLNNVDARL